MAEKEKIYTGAILILGANQLIETVAFGIPYSYFPLYALSLGSSVALIGLFTSAFMFMSMLLSPILGGYSDRFGRKKLIQIGLVGGVIFGAMTGLVSSWQWLLVVRAINGAVTAAATIPAEALLIDLSPPGRVGEAVGFVMACGMVGRNIGPLFGGAIQWFSLSEGLSLIDSYRVPYFVDAGFAAIIPFSGSFNVASIIYSARGFMWSIYNVGLRALRADLAPPEIRGKLFGLYRMFFDAGDIFGPLMATYIYDLYRFDTFTVGSVAVPGYGIPFYINSIIGLITLAILLLFVNMGGPTTTGSKIKTQSQE